MAAGDAPQFSVQLPQLGPGTEAFVEGLLRRIAQNDAFLERSKQLTADTYPDVTPDEFLGLWLYTACHWLDINCTPELVRGLCSEDEQRAFLLHLVALAEAREAAAGNPSASLSGWEAASMARRSSSMAASTSSSLQDGQGGDAGGLGRGLLGPYTALQTKLAEKYSALLPAPLRVTPPDMLASLAVHQRPSQEELEAQLKRLQARVAELQPAPPRQGGAAGGEDALQQAAALGQLEASFLKFLAADDEFQQWCDAEVAVWGRLKSGPPSGQLGADAEDMLQQQQRLQLVVASLDSLQQTYLLRPPAPTAALHASSGLSAAQGDASTQAHWVPALMAKVQASSAQLSTTLQRLQKLSTARTAAARGA